MKKIIHLIIVGFTILSSPAVTALPARPSTENPGWFGDLGLEGYHYNYREVIGNDQFFMSDTGPMYGIYYAFGYQPEFAELRAVIEGHLTASSSIHYKSNGTGSSNNNNYSASELILLGIYSWALEDQWKVEGYMGLGGRTVINDASNMVTSTGHYGYLRVNPISYIPVGLKIVKDVGEFRWIGHLEYDFFMKGEQRCNGNIHVQKSGRGARMGVDFLIPSSFADFDYRIGAFIRYWDINATDWIPSAYSPGEIAREPKNTTYEIGVRLGLAF